MNWLVKTFSSSIGKKQVQAVTGLLFCLFVAVHLMGNLTIYAGKESFLSYVDHLHSFEALVTVAEFGLIFFAVLHIGMGLYLFLENRRARPVAYAVDKSAGGRTIGSRTAPYTGALILVFVIFHLIRFRFVDKMTINDFTILSNTFAEFGFWTLFYIAGVIVVAVHVSHGFWSGFQTLGLNHPKYMPVLERVGIIFSLIIGIGFASIPVFLFVSL
ncbi:MAG: succinate dehydrogenase cytochrome b subunit [Deltaproteobacteria bacterium]|jgi:succinate dehydrogenase / fumarate reductase cytochrome b subunit|nr:succinate dehydrogenase cytochrome b subunit [Deltaproteobacteria bacterium]